MGIWSIYNRVNKMNEINSNSPEECYYLLFHTFMNKDFYAIYNTSSYIKWLNEQDLKSAYEYYKKLLKLIMFPQTKVWGNFWSRGRTSFISYSCNI